MSERSQTTAPLSGSDAWYPAQRRDFFVLKELVSKDFRLKYRRSILGVAWSVLNPLLMMIVMAAVFSTFMNRADETITNFPLYLILGNTAFSLMADATSQGMGSIIGAASLLKKVRVNRYVFPVQKVLFSIVNYAFSLIAVGLVMLWFRIPLTGYALLLPVFVVLLGAFCTGLSLLLSALAVFFRDVIHLWGVVLTAWTYATPLFYPASILPAWMLALERFNPMFHFVTFIRDILLYQQLPSAGTVAGCVVSAIISCVIGIAVFRANERKFILYI